MVLTRALSVLTVVLIILVCCDLALSMVEYIKITHNEQAAADAKAFHAVDCTYRFARTADLVNIVSHRIVRDGSAQARFSVLAKTLPDGAAINSRALAAFFAGSGRDDRQYLAQVKARRIIDCQR